MKKEYNSDDDSVRAVKKDESGQQTIIGSISINFQNNQLNFQLQNFLFLIIFYYSKLVNIDFSIIDIILKDAESAEDNKIRHRYYADFINTSFKEKII